MELYVGYELLVGGLVLLLLGAPDGASELESSNEVKFRLGVLVGLLLIGDGETIGKGYVIEAGAKEAEAFVVPKSCSVELS